MSTEIEWNLINKIAWSFFNTTGHDFNDLKSEATLAYLKALQTYNPEKSAISTWVWIRMRNALIDYLAKEKRNTHGELPENLYDDSFKNQIEFQSIIDFSTGLDAQHLFKIIVRRPQHFITRNYYNTRESLYRILKRADKRWTRKRIKYSCEELRICLRKIG